MNTKSQQRHFPRHLPGIQAGVTLIELMIASVIGLFILAGVVTVFSSSSASSSMSSGMGRLQESGRIALEILSNSTRMAGYIGCLSYSKGDPIVLANTNLDVTVPDIALWGSEVGPTGWSPPRLNSLANIDSLVKVNTDVFFPQYAGGRSTTLSSDMTGPNDSTISLTDNPDELTAGDMIMISDCDSSHIIRATAVGVAADGSTTVTFGVGATGNTQANLGYTYKGSGAPEATALRVARFEATAFFIGDSGRDTPGGHSIFSLFALDTTTNPIGAPVELIEGVENLQILYGESNGTSIDKGGTIRYVTANNVSNPDNIVSVQIGILIGTADYASRENDNRSYNIAGVTVGPPGSNTAGDSHAGDRRLRAAFNITIQLRNQIPI